MAGDCAQLIMLQLPEAARQVWLAVKNLAASSLLRKDVVPVVVPELPFSSSLRKVIGDAANPLPLRCVGDIRVILPLLGIWAVVFVGHCAFLLQLLQSIRDAKAGSREQSSM
jgi:hypothetical protein